MPPPTQDDLLALAERATELVGDTAQATAWWERQLSAGPAGAVTTSGLSVEIAAVRDGRVGVVTTTEVDETGLARAAAGAWRLAASGPAASGFPEPAAGRAHDGYDQSILSFDPADAGEALGPWDAFRAAAASTAIASTTGVRAAEDRSFVDLRVRRHDASGRSLELSAAAVGPAGVDPAALGAEAEALLAGTTESSPAAVAPGEYPVVLGPWAVAEVLRRAALAFAGPRAPLAGRLGTRVAASCVNLSDSPRFAAQLPRSYDAEGAPRQPLPLIQDGVAHRLVEAGTGHALAPGNTAGTAPEHLVLVGGGAADLAELAEPIEHGLLIPALSVHGAWIIGRPGSALAEGVQLIRDGRAAGPVPNLTVLFEPIELLARAQALTARQRTIPPPIQRSARTAAATVAPALRAGGGLHVAGAA